MTKEDARIALADIIYVQLADLYFTHIEEFIALAENFPNKRMLISLRAEMMEKDDKC